MGVLLEIYQCRIGLYGCRCSSGSSFPLCISFLSLCIQAGKIGLVMRILAFATLCALLLIGNVEANPGPEYRCSVCSLALKTASAYFRHVEIHRSVKNLSHSCIYEGCFAKLSTLVSFKTHMSRYHSEKRQTAATSTHNEGLPCPLSMNGCMHVLSSFSQYRQHMVVHLDAKESFTCPLKRRNGEKCESNMHSVSQFRTHVSRYHDSSMTLLQAVGSVPNISGPLSVSLSRNEDDSVSYAGDSQTHDDDVEMMDEEDEDLYPDFAIKDELARFYLKLEAEHLLPTTTVQAIAEEVKLLSHLSHHRLKKGLTRELEAIKVDKNEIDTVIRKTFSEDTVFNTHHKGHDTVQFGSGHLRTKYWRENFHFVEPQKVSIGPSADTNKQKYAYRVPIRENLREVFKDQQVKDAVKDSFNRQQQAVLIESEVLEDFTDGAAFKNHAKFHDGKPCIQLFLFQDEFDPNAFSSGKHKPLDFYYTIGNVPAELRTRLDLIFLAFTVLGKDLKNSQAEELNDEDRLEKCLKPLIEELIDLHENGIEIDGQTVQVCVMYLLGDSLGQNFIGSFVRNFSTCEFSCRFCTLSKTDFQMNPCATKPIRTEEEYDEYVLKAKRKWVHDRQKGLDDFQKAKERAKNQDTLGIEKNVVSAMSKSAYSKLTAINFRGVKYRPSPFNRVEMNFHVAGAQPPCLAHDLFEGIVKLVLPKILKHFIDLKWFDLVTLNRRILTFECVGTDALDKPKSLKSSSEGKGLLLSGHAVENWNLLRLLPFIIGDLIKNEEDPYWVMYLTLKEVTDYVCAPKITVSQVDYLRNLIKLYLQMVNSYLTKCLTPKHHYLCHYPDLILWFGPLIRLFTLRFESKHAFFKRVMLSCKNYINVLYTMSRKYMCRAAYDRKYGLLPVAIEHDLSFPVDVTSLPPSVLAELPPDAEQLHQVSIFGTEFKIGSYLLHDHVEDIGLRVGSIDKIFLEPKSNQILFMLHVKVTTHNSGYYVVQQQSDEYVLRHFEDLPDYYPLSAYNVNNHQCLSLKHTATFM